MLGIVCSQAIEICRSADIAADAVQVKAKPSQPQIYIKLPGYVDDLGIEGGVVVSQGLDTKLVMLSVSSGLRTLIPKDSCHIVEPHRLGKGVHPVLHIGTADRRSPFGTEGQLIPTPILKRVHLLLYNIGLLTDAAHEKASVLKSGGVYALISIQFRDGNCLLRDVAPISLLSG